MDAQTPTCRILLVEDDPDTRIVMARLLERSGYAVAAADTCAGAIELAKRERFDVLVADIGLPDGNGFELFAQVSGLYTLPAIAVSGYGSAADVAASRAAGFVRHLVKPIAASDLFAAIEETRPCWTSGTHSSHPCEHSSNYFG